MGQYRFLYIPDDWVRDHLGIEETIEIVEKVYGEDGEGRVTLSRPSALTLVPHDADLAGYKVKGTIVPHAGAAGFRIIPTSMTGGAEAGGHRKASSYCYLIDSESGRPLALVDERWQCLVRTGVTGAVAVKYLASRDADTVALVGAGRIARHFVEAVSKVFHVRELRVISRRSESGKSFVDECRSRLGLNAHHVQDVQDAVAGASVVVTITNADEPVLYPEWIDKGTTVCALGGAMELAPEFVRVVDKVIVDDLSWCKMAGSIGGWISRGYVSEADVDARIYGTIGQVVAGKVVGRENTQETILAVIQGVASCDLTIARRIYEKAIHDGSLGGFAI